MLLTTKPQTARLTAVKEKAAGEFTGKLKSQNSKASHLFPLIAMGKQTMWLKKKKTTTNSEPKG